MRDNRPKDDIIPFGKAVFWIFLSTLIITGTAILVWVYFKHIENLRGNDDKYRIIAVVQTGPEKEALKTVYLEELLDISIDKPANLYSLDTREAQKKLLASPLIKKASVKKMNPGTLYIDYSIRQPVAYSGDFTNTAIDADGILIPFKPFFTPKKIPEIYVGLHNDDEAISKPLNMEEIWGMKLENKKFALAFEMLDSIANSCCLQTSHIRKIDVSRAYSDSYGQRQIIVVVEDWFEKNHDGRSILCIFPRILRLSTNNYRQELFDFTLLREYLQHQELQQIVDSSQAVVRTEPMIIDMRTPQVAFLKE